MTGGQRPRIWTFQTIYKLVVSQHFFLLSRKLFFFALCEAVASTDRSTKRKCGDDEHALGVGPHNMFPDTETSRFEGDLYSCLFDQNNRCTFLISMSQVQPQMFQPRAL